MISLQDASNCIRVFIFPISSGKLTSLLLLTIKPEKKGISYNFFVLFFSDKTARQMLVLANVAKWQQILILLQEIYQRFEHFVDFFMT